MKTVSAKKAFGTATFERIHAAKYHAWEDAFEIEFESGISYLLSHAKLRKANNLSEEAPEVQSVQVDPELRSGFYVSYVDGSKAEASWELVKESAPTRS